MALQTRDTYEGEIFELKLPTIDHVVHQILNIDDPLLMKVDISRAFRNIKIDPRDAIKCGLRHQGQFGAIMSTKIFQRISDAIAYIMQQNSRKIPHRSLYLNHIFITIGYKQSFMFSRPSFIKTMHN